MATESVNDNLIEITWADGTSARWAVTQEEADKAGELLERELRTPDTLIC